jgi:hypothetical protein
MCPDYQKYLLLVLVALLLLLSFIPTYGQSYSVPSSGLSQSEAIELLQIIDEQQMLLNESSTLLKMWQDKATTLEIQYASLTATFQNLEIQSTQLQNSVRILQNSANESLTLTKRLESDLHATRTVAKVLGISLVVSIVGGLLIW